MDGVRSKVLTHAALPEAHEPEGLGIRFSLPGLVAFSASLILASGALVFTLMRTLNHDFRARLPAVVAQSSPARGSRK